MKTRSELYEERRQRRNKVIISVVMIAIMLMSTVAYAFYYFTGDSTTIRYNGHKLRAQVEGGYVQGYTTKVDGKTLTFYSTPEDSLPIQLPPGMIGTLREADVIVFLFDPTDNQTAFYDALRFDFSEALPNLQAGAVTQPSAIYNLPVLSCNNATAEYPFIYFTHGNMSVTYNGCYVVAGEGQGFALLRDRIVYAYYGITQE